MKKNVFSRTLAVLASTAVLGAASMMSASAAGEVFTIGSAEAVPGQTVQLTVSASANNCLESLDVLFGYDSALTASLAKGIGDFSGGSEIKEGSAVSFAGMTMLADGISDGPVITLEFTVPEDAEVGTVYDVVWDTINVAATLQDGEVTDTATFNPGTITVIAPETEAPTPTDAPTDAPTEAATTTTTKAPTTGAPKTGTAGVAVAVAGLVTAGATAVVLKKRH